MREELPAVSASLRGRLGTSLVTCAIVAAPTFAKLVTCGIGPRVYAIAQIALIIIGSIVLINVWCDD